MGFLESNYGDKTPLGESIQDMDAFNELSIYLEAMNLSSDDRAALVESPEFLALEAKGLIGRKTIVKLKLGDDLERRETMAAFQLAKENNDSLWTKLTVNRTKERDLIGKILAKYRNKAARVAKANQKSYIKQMKSGVFVKKTDIDNRA